jgi:DNA-binding response OmpR family regulator
MRILIVEDDAALASFIRKGLEAEHHAVDVAHEGNQGRAMAMEFDYDLVVLDLNLPGVDGLSVLKSLRQRKANLPVMILTARSRVEDRVQCLDSGADDYLVKPFSYLELSARARARCCGAVICHPNRFSPSVISAWIAWNAKWREPDGTLN